MRIAPWDPADDKTTRACYDVAVAAHLVDEPVEPPQSYPMFAAFLQYGWERTPAETWLCFADDDSVAGYYRVALPDLENRDKAFGGPILDPARRRRGLGRELLRHLVGRAEAHGRDFIDVELTAGGAGDAFARAVGAKLDLEDVRRVQYLREIEPGTVAALRREAEQHAAGYSLVTWTGPVPDEQAAAVAEVFNAFNDAPHGENQEPELWDADRIRTRTGLYERLGLCRSYTVAAAVGTSGELAALTEVTIMPEHPDWGFQQLTAVLRAHRGHRLGLLVKTAMLERLATAEPQLERIVTGNASTNQHMIAVNEQLGYRVVEPGWKSYQLAVAAMR